MRVKALVAYQARIPLKRDVKHASHARKSTDSLLVLAQLEDGTQGWGEGLPREYVTGETIASCFKTLRAIDWRPLSGTIDGLVGMIDRCRRLRMPEPPAGKRDCFGNTVRCAVELALLDAAARCEGVPLSHVTSLVEETQPIRRPVESVRYDAAVMSVKPWKEAAQSLGFRLYGFERCKVKVGVAGQDEAASLRRIRRWAGPGMDLRVDANEGWSPSEVERRIAALEPFGITSVEQPVPHEQIDTLRKIRPNVRVPIMLDESLCSRSDATRAIDEGLCDLFNIRLSKCGGFLNSLRLAAMAQRAGLGYQLGCMVGETGILSAAGRHFACSVDGLRFLEGSFDRHLVAESLTNEDLTFGRGGVAAALTGPGLGVTIDRTALERVASACETFPISSV